MGLEIRPKRELSVSRLRVVFWICFTDKSDAAMKVGVPVVPGTPGPVDSYTDGDAFIKEYGFPGQFNMKYALRAPPDNLL